MSAPGVEGLTGPFAAGASQALVQGPSTGSWTYKRKVNPKYVETVEISERKCTNEAAGLAPWGEPATLVLKVARSSLKSGVEITYLNKT